MAHKLYYEDTFYSLLTKTSWTLNVGKEIHLALNFKKKKHFIGYIFVEKLSVLDLLHIHKSFYFLP